MRKTTELHYILIPINPRLEAPIEFKKQYRFDRDIQLGTVFGTVVAKTGAVVEYFTTSFKNEQYMNSVQWADIDRRTGQLRINQKPDDHLVNMEITLLSEGFTKTITVCLLLLNKPFANTNNCSKTNFKLNSKMNNCSNKRVSSLTTDYTFLHTNLVSIFMSCRRVC